MNIRYILTGVTLIVLASCSRSEIIEVNDMKRAIDFRIAVDTRAEEVTTSNLGSFYVTSLDSDGAVLFDGVEYSDNDSDGIYKAASSYYWPISGDVKFFAYSPSSSDLGGALTITNSVKKLESFSPAQTIADQKDFVTAVATGNREENKAGVALTFNHQLSQIEILAKNESAYVYNVKGVRIGKVASVGTFDFETAEWSDVGTNVNYEVKYDTPVSLDETAESIMGAGGNAMLIPQTLVGWANLTDKTNQDEGAYLAVYVNIETETGIQVYPSDDGDYAWVAVPISNNWEAGIKYMYILDFTSGSGYVDPEDEDNPGEKVLGESIKFSLTTSVIGWTQNN